MSLQTQCGLHTDAAAFWLQDGRLGICKPWRRKRKAGLLCLLHPGTSMTFSARNSSLSLRSLQPQDTHHLLVSSPPAQMFMLKGEKSGQKLTTHMATFSLESSSFFPYINILYTHTYIYSYKKQMKYILFYKIFFHAARGSFMMIFFWLPNSPLVWCTIINYFPSLYLLKYFWSCKYMWARGRWQKHGPVVQKFPVWSRKHCSQRWEMQWNKHFQSAVGIAKE